MPKTRKLRRSNRGKTRKMPRKAAYKTTLVNRANLAPVPSRFITKMKYAEAVVLSGTGLRSYQWNLNSLFDPNRTGTGHQPYGFAQLCGSTSLYNRYRVFAARYVLSVANDTYNIHYAALPANGNTLPISNVSEARENPRCQYNVQNPNGTLKRLTGKVNLPALTGRTKQQYMSDDRYQAQYNATPDETMTLNIYCQGMNDDTGVSMSHTVNILIEYYVEFFDPNNVDTQ